MHMCHVFYHNIELHHTPPWAYHQMLLSYRPRARLGSLLRPDINNRVHLKQQSQKCHHGQKTKERKFQRGDNVSVRNFANNTWIPGVIEELSISELLSFQVKL